MEKQVQVKRMVSILVAAGLVLPLQLTHSLAQDIVLGSRPSGDTIALHASGAARALEMLPGTVTDIMQRSGVPGVAVAVVHEGKVAFARGFGVADMRTEIPVTTNTVFQIASVSKPISATVTAVAVTRGDVEWDDPVTDHLPMLQLSDSYPTRHATIGDFFAHRSGLPAAAGDELEDLGFSRDEVIARLAHVPLDPFRISYHYANFGTTIAAEAVAAAAGTEWEQLAQDYLFASLGMNATSYRHADYVSADDRAVLHAFENGSFQPLYSRDADAQAPAGGVSSTVHDLAKWLQLILGEGAVGDHRLFRADALLPAFQPQITSSPKAGYADRSGAYGYGFNVGVSAGGQPVMSHSGAFLLGAATHVEVLPGADIGIVVLSNGAPVGAVEAISAHFMDVVQFGKSTRDWFAAYNGVMSQLFEPVGDLAGKDIPKTPEPHRDLGGYAGRYDSAYYGPAEIVLEDGNLVLALGPDAMRFPLRHWNGDTFALAPRGENAPAGSLSSVRFKIEEGQESQFTVEYLDQTGLGTWRRAD